MKSIEQALRELDKAAREVCEWIDAAPDISPSMSEALRLQMAMDRLSKLMATLSNLLKKTSQTADAITQNIH